MEVETFLDDAQIDHLHVLLFFFIHELGLQRGGLIIKGGLLRLDEVTNVARLGLDRRNGRYSSSLEFNRLGLRFLRLIIYL